MFNKQNNAAFSFATTMAIGIALSIFLGLKLDEFLNTKPLFIIIFVFYTMIGAFVKLIKDTK